LCGNGSVIVVGAAHARASCAVEDRPCARGRSRTAPAPHPSEKALRSWSTHHPATRNRVKLSTIQKSLKVIVRLLFGAYKHGIRQHPTSTNGRWFAPGPLTATTFRLSAADAPRGDESLAHLPTAGLWCGGTPRCLSLPSARGRGPGITLEGGQNVRPIVPGEVSVPDPRCQHSRRPRRRAAVWKWPLLKVAASTQSTPLRRVA
jgi:hypothetical protein